MSSTLEMILKITQEAELKMFTNSACSIFLFKQTALQFTVRLRYSQFPVDNLLLAQPTPFSRQWID